MAWLLKSIKSVKFRRLNSNLVLLIIYLFVSFDIFAAPSRRSCISVLSAQPASQLAPIDAFKTMRERYLEQLENNSARAFGFSTKGIFELTVSKMTRNLEQRIQILQTSGVDAKAVQFAKDVFNYAKETNETLAYDEVILLSYLHSLVMSIEYKNLNYDNSYLLGRISEIKISTDGFYSRFTSSHPVIGFYFPEVGVSHEIDIIRNRSALLYVIGLVSEPTFADGSSMTPYNFFIHDQSAHAGRSWVSDHVRLTDVTTEEAIYKDLSDRAKKMALVDKIMNDPKISDQLKSYYKNKLFEFDHEGVGKPVFAGNDHLRILKGYFRTKSSDRQADFRYLYKSYSAFRAYCDGRADK
jgi:hypothetical protein